MWGAVLTGVAAIILAVSALITSLGTYRTVKTTHALMGQVDRAVNGKPPGATTMVQQVQDLTDQAFPPPVENGDAVLPILRRIEELLHAKA